MSTIMVYLNVASHHGKGLGAILVKRGAKKSNFWNREPRTEGEGRLTGDTRWRSSPHTV